ncbi:hypothetical protein [Stackebrandtia soli]|uniref:hypothetical protein n=1 Tax=Stackebrandtia soli TaxID=1892856 RepID=UPI0039EAE7AD
MGVPCHSSGVLDVPDATTFSCPDRTTLTRLDDLGPAVTARLLEPDRAVFAAHSTLN